MKKSAEIYGEFLKEYLISDSQLSDLKGIGVEMLKTFHKICVENNIFYSIAYGTMLGAVRHCGYIPWDDDIDVYMYRKDYQKFCQIINDQYSNKYYVMDNSVNKQYNLQFPKLIKKETLLIEANNDNKYQTGCYVDIFLLEDAPKRFRKIRKIFFLVCRMAASLECDYKFPSKAITQKAKESKVVKNYYNLRRFVGFFASAISIRCWCKLCKTLLKGTTVDNEVVELGEQIRYFDKTLIDNVKIYNFEGEKFYGMADYDKYLSIIYGDYMVLPPEDKRDRHIIIKLDVGNN